MDATITGVRVEFMIGPTMVCRSGGGFDSSAEHLIEYAHNLVDEVRVEVENAVKCEV